MTYSAVYSNQDHEDHSNLLSPTIAYYIRRLIRQNIDRLQSVVAKGAGLEVDPLSDLNAVINSLYLEPEEIASAVLKLEKLTALHQGLLGQAGSHRKELLDIEQQIFWILGFKPIQAKHQGTILVVDDTPENLRLLTSTLRQDGYEVSCAISGEMALDAVQHVLPDLILLDICMPGLDGYQVCKKMKASFHLQDVPILFLSAIDEVADKVKAFELGGADYITKPFQIEEVLARVQHQLKLRDLQKRLEQQNVNLQKEVRDRQVFETQLDVQAGHIQALLNNIPHLAWLKDAKNRYIAVNDIYCQRCGMAADQLISKTLGNAQLPALISKHFKLDADVISSSQSRHLEDHIIDAEGVERRVEISIAPIYNRANQVIGAAGIGVDLVD
ncbi:MAG: response regulator [Elainellaceae cyanobacterium]